jgi:hypothetical protein
MAQGIYDLLEETLKLTTNLNKQLCCNEVPISTTTTIPLGCFLTTDVSNFTYPTTAIFFNINIPNESNCESYQESASSLEDTPIVINNINDLVQVLNDTLYFPNPFGSFFISGPNQISLLFNEDLNYVCDCILSSISITNL